jgi:hypothetical protein
MGVVVKEEGRGVGVECVEERGEVQRAEGGVVVEVVGLEELGEEDCQHSDFLASG